MYEMTGVVYEHTPLHTPHNIGVNLMIRLLAQGIKSSAYHSKILYSKTIFVDEVDGHEVVACQDNGNPQRRYVHHDRQNKQQEDINYAVEPVNDWFFIGLVGV